MKRYEPYSKVDFNLAAAQLSPEEYTALRNEAMAAYQDVEFLTPSTSTPTLSTSSNSSRPVYASAATATLKELADPEKGIEGLERDHVSRHGQDRPPPSTACRPM